MSWNPPVRAILDERNRADPDIDDSRIAAPRIACTFCRPSECCTIGYAVAVDRGTPHRGTFRGDWLASVYPTNVCTRTNHSVLSRWRLLHGDLNTTDCLCRSLAIGSHGTVASVDYRLVPEAPFPARVDDAQDSLRWVIQYAAAFGADATRVAVAGNSSGGNFAAVVAQWARSQGIALRHQRLLFPVTDGSCESSSYSTFADGYFLTADTMRWFWRNYLPNANLAADPRISPLLEN